MCSFSSSYPPRAMSELRFSLSERSASSSGGGASGRVVHADGKVQDALDAVHKDDPNIAWAVVGYQPDTIDQLVLLGSGSGGPDEMAKCLTDDIAAYGLLRVLDVVDNIKTNRYVLITWMGDTVSGVRKAKLAVNKEAVLGIIGHYSVEFVASDHDEISTEQIMGKVQDASGSRNREKRFENVQYQSSSKLHVKATDNREVQKAKDRVPTNNQVITWVNEDDLRAKLQAVRSDSSNIRWVVFGYQGKADIGFVAEGEGELGELRAALDESAVLYGLYRAYQTVDQTTQARFFMFTWVGPRVSPLTKGRLTSHKGAVTEFFEPYHISLHASDLDELSDEVIGKSIKSLK